MVHRSSSTSDRRRRRSRSTTRREAVTIDLLPPAPVAPPPPPAAAARPAPTQATPAPAHADRDGSGIKTIVIDPGHGGDEEGVKSADRHAGERPDAASGATPRSPPIESRLGIRVLLTRDTDEALAVDRRTAFANNNKADLFLSLHANSSVRPAARGAQVYSLDVRTIPGSSPRPKARSARSRRSAAARA